jgi:hypothetical protein
MRNKGFFATCDRGKGRMLEAGMNLSGGQVLSGPESRRVIEY